MQSTGPCLKICRKVPNSDKRIFRGWKDGRKQTNDRGVSAKRVGHFSMAGIRVWNGLKVLKGSQA